MLVLCTLYCTRRQTLSGQTLSESVWRQTLSESVWRRSVPRGRSQSAHAKLGKVSDLREID
eukprot:COSAG06_NODE_2690_length_6444_cov_24.545154_5_plen_61_part_00